jgi:hypothetical protein
MVMDVNKAAFATLLFFTALAAGMKSIAQASQHQTKSQQQVFLLNGKITLDSLTKLVHNKSGVRFSFNSVKVKGSKEIIFPKGGYSLSHILQRIKETTSLYFKFYSGYVIFQDNPPKQKPLTVAPKNYARPTTYQSQNNKTAKVPVKNARLKNQYKDREKKIEPEMENIPVSTDNRIPTGSSDSIVHNPTSIIKKEDLHVQDTFRAASINVNTKAAASDSSKNSNIVNQPTPTTISTREKNRNPLTINYGLQWNLTIPVYGFSQYFTGTNGKQQYYNSFIPGLWIGITIGNNGELLLMAKPGRQYLTGNKTVAIESGPNIPPDTMLVQKTISVLKTNSTYAGLQYNYNLTNNWTLGASIHIHWQTAALARERSIRLFNSKVLSDTLYGIKKSSPGWQYMEPTFFTGRLEASYRLNKVQVGAAVWLPITGMLSSSLNNYRPVNGHFFLRWRLHQS